MTESTATKQCPYCMGTIPAAAQKCEHCGEWVNRPPREADRDTGTLKSFFEGETLDETLNSGVKWYIKYRIVMTIIGFVIFLIFFLGVWLPGWTRANRDFNRPPGSFPQIVQPLRR